MGRRPGRQLGAWSPWGTSRLRMDRAVRDSADRAVRLVAAARASTYRAVRLVAALRNSWPVEYTERAVASAGNTPAGNAPAGGIARLESPGKPADRALRRIGPVSGPAERLAAAKRQAAQPSRLLTRVRRESVIRLMLTSGEPHLR